MPSHENEIPISEQAKKEVCEVIKGQPCGVLAQDIWPEALECAERMKQQVAEEQTAAIRFGQCEPLY